MDDNGHDHANGFSSAERPLIDAAWSQFESLASARSSVDRSADGLAIPGYRILREIHRGGQGVVYQAVQESTGRKVAVKLLKHGPLADPNELARFDREVDVLSRLNHPHIVAIHDRGLTPGGHSYYVMDYIPGRLLDAHVSGAALSTRDTLTLFHKICEAVNVAHLHGVIHRDLKPSNIRVDEDGEPHILDFGLAKLIREPGAASAVMTVTGQFIGSLPWASPEQADGRSDLLDLRTDVYSVGVILFQLLTRSFPYAVTGRLNEIAQNIIHTAPARPSTLRPDLDRDVEVILLKCLAKDPNRRYQSAGEVARDVRRYLDGEPIEARRASSFYQFRQFARRNKPLVISMAAVMTILAAAAAVSVAFGLSEGRQRRAAELAQGRAEKAEREAETQAGELEQVVRFQQAQLSGIDAQTMGMRLRASLLEKVRAAAEKSKLPSEEVGSKVQSLEELVAGSNFTGIALEALDENVFQPALVAIEAQFGNQPLIKARLLQTLASTQQELGLLHAATKPQDEALAIRRHALGDEHRDTLSSIASMGYLLRAQGKLDQAEPYYLEALTENRRLLGDDHPSTLNAMNNMGSLLQAKGKLDQAEPYFREVLEKRRGVLGGEHPDTLISINNMGDLLQAQGKLDQAETYWREALEGFRRGLGDEHPHTLISINNMGYLLQAQGKLDQAEPYWREAMEKYRRVLGDEHPGTLRSIYNMGYLLQAQGKLDEAEPYYREALDKRRRVLGDEHPDTLISISNMGLLLQAQGKSDQAEPYYLEALEKRRRVLGDEHPHTLASIGSMGSLLQAQGRPAPAIEVLLPAEAAARRAFTGANAVRLARFLTALGCARAGLGKFEAAEATLTEAHTILSEAPGATARDRQDLLQCIAQLYQAWNTAEPDKGYAEKMNEWRSRLDALAPTTATKN